MKSLIPIRTQTLRRIVYWLTLSVLVHARGAAVQSGATNANAAIDQRVKEASAKLGAVMPQAEKLTIQGKSKEAEALIRDVFPVASRSPEESLVLGNVLFKAQPKQAYDFHRQAAAQLPRYPGALLEWALEQHRAKNYAGAAATYAAYNKAVPEHAPIWGLAAECAVRTGKLAEAVVLWKSSEKAQRGTLEQLEELVCEVNGRLPNAAVREDLLQRVEKRDERAARDVLLLDAAWESDWWNTGPRRAQLEYDVATVRRVFAKRGAAIQPALCVAECALIEGATGRRAILVRYGYLVDPKATLPTMARRCRNCSDSRSTRGS